MFWLNDPVLNFEGEWPALRPDILIFREKSSRRSWLRGWTTWTALFFEILFRNHLWRKCRQITEILTVHSFVNDWHSGVFGQARTRSRKKWYVEGVPFQALKAYGRGGIEIQLQSLVWGEGSTSCPGRFTPGEKTSMDPRAGLDFREKLYQNVQLSILFRTAG